MQVSGGPSLDLTAPERYPQSLAHSPSRCFQRKPRPPHPTDTACPLPAPPCDTGLFPRARPSMTPAVLLALLPGVQVAVAARGSAGGLRASSHGLCGAASAGASSFGRAAPGADRTPFLEQPLPVGGCTGTIATSQATACSFTVFKSVLSFGNDTIIFYFWLFRVDHVLFCHRSLGGCVHGVRRSSRGRVCAAAPSHRPITRWSTCLARPPQRPRHQHKRLVLHPPSSFPPRSLSPVRPGRRPWWGRSLTAGGGGIRASSPPPRFFLPPLQPCLRLSLPPRSLSFLLPSPLPLPNYSCPSPPSAPSPEHRRAAMWLTPVRP